MGNKNKEKQAPLIFPKMAVLKNQANPCMSHEILMLHLEDSIILLYVKKCFLQNYMKYMAKH